jgi:glyoxylase-like metal-dependent hydrolase (beta-lactamase superfamily II)
LQQLTKNVYTETKIRGCNPGIVFTDEGSVFVDSPQWVTVLLKMREFALERGPIKYLINTESHIDHIFGNHWFAGECPVVGHETLHETFWKIPPSFNMTTYDYSVDILKRQDPEGLPYMPAEQDYIINPPGITFSERMSLKVGNHDFLLFHTPGHSEANISVYVPQEKVVFVGDTVFSSCQTWLHSADPDKLFNTLKFLATLDVDYIVPGHGEVVDKKYLFEQAAVVYDWLGTVAHGMAKGWTRDECVERINFESYAPVDIGQAECMEYIQTANAAVSYNYLNAPPKARG